MASKMLLFLNKTLNLKIKKILTLILLLGVFLIFSGWADNSTNSSITDYYYYQNQPYHLTVRTNKVFIQLKQTLSKDAFRTVIDRYYQLAPTGKFDQNEKRQFVDLVMNYDQASISTLVSALNRDPQIEFASAVYSPKENNNVLQGVLDQILVQFKREIGKNQIDNYIKSNNFTIVQPLDLTGGTAYVLSVDRAAGMQTIDIADNVYNSGLVNWAEPNFYFYGLLSYTPNDQYYPMQWSIKNTGNNIPGSISGVAGCDMRVDSAWDLTLGNSQCVVGMVDSGIDTLHEDLAGNLIPGSGYDFINGHPGCMDDFNHGTCTAGIVAAVGNNTIGVSGIAPQCKLIGIKIFNSGGSTSSSAIVSGLLYSWQQGEWVSSNSWGGGSPISAADQAITDGTNLGRSGKGTVFCFASGNNNSVLIWPSTHANVIAVGGVSPCNQRKSPSSCDNESWWGADYGTGLHVVAPCVKVYATDRTGSAGYDPSNYFAQFNGTSSATPNCAGVCALVMSLDSTLRWDSVRVKLCRTADKVGSYTYTSSGPISSLGNTWNNEMGYGKVNAFRLLSSIAPPPSPVQHDIATGPFLSLPSQFLINLPYDIKARIQNVGHANETNIPIKFFINGTLDTTISRNLDTTQVDSVSYAWTPTAMGQFELMYVSALATDTNRTNDTVRTTVTVYSTAPPLCEGFGGSTFPPQDWSLIYTGSNYWSQASYSAWCLGTNSAEFDFYDALSGTQQSLVTKGFPASTGNTDSLVFMDAYATYQTENDQLLIYTSTDNGTTYTPLVTLNGGVSGELVTAPPTLNPFSPTCTQWKRQVHSVPIGTNKIKFTAISAYGNNLYLDSICVIHPVGIQPIALGTPHTYSLMQNYPNPFNPTTDIKYAVPRQVFVKLVIYDILGREVRTLVNEVKPAGYYSISFDASGYASGVYFYRIEAGDFTDVKKMVLLK